MTHHCHECGMPCGPEYRDEDGSVVCPMCFYEVVAYRNPAFECESCGRIVPDLPRTKLCPHCA